MVHAYRLGQRARAGLDNGKRKGDESASIPNMFSNKTTEIILKHTQPKKRRKTKKHIFKTCCAHNLSRLRRSRMHTPLSAAWDRAVSDKLSRQEETL